MRDFHGVCEDVLVKGDLVHKGRECRARLDMILPYVETGAKVLDIGSHTGYFAIELAREKNCRVDSFESHARLRKIQKWAIQQNNVGRKVKLHRVFEPAKLEGRYEVVLLLSVLHYFSESFLGEVAHLGEWFIIEWPTPAETTALYHDLIMQWSPFEDHLHKVFEHVELIGEPDAPYMPGVKRGMWLCGR